MHRLRLKGLWFETMTIRRLAVLLVTSHRAGQTALQEIGSADSAYDDSELVDYAELLSGTNIPFDTIHYQDVNDTTFYDGEALRYAIVLFAVPLSSLSDEALSIVRDGSFNRGISLLASYTQADGRSKAFFGIVKFRGKNPLWPLKVRILSRPRGPFSKEVVVDYGLSSGMTGIRARGFGKLSIRRTMLKGLKILKSLILPFVGVKLEQAAEILATTLSGRPLVWSFAFGRAINYYVGLRGDLYLDKFNEMHQLIRTLVESNSGHGMVSADLAGTMVLRLDDPGSCAVDYLSSGSILDKKGWEDLGAYLQSQGIPLSVMYTPGWVDDGDRSSGRLFIDGSEVYERVAGTVYESSRVYYLPFSGAKGGYDHADEFRGLNELVQAGVIDVQSHGETHLVPDRVTWSRSIDRRKDADWYHEFYDVKNNRPVGANDQLSSMKGSKEKINRKFGKESCALAPSGHRHDSSCDTHAAEAGYAIFTSDYTGLCIGDKLVRNWKIPAVFLYLKDPTPFVSRSGYPVVGVVHDYEIQKDRRGLERILRQWMDHGVKRFVSLRELAVSLCSSIESRYAPSGDGLFVTITLPRKNSQNAWEGTAISVKVVLPAQSTFDEARRVSIEGGVLRAMTRQHGSRIMELLVTVAVQSVIEVFIPLQSLEFEKN